MLVSLSAATNEATVGVRNLRAICPNCGGKIHTQPKGLGRISLWGNSWFMVQTGTECQHCSQALTGKVKASGEAEAANGPKSYGAGPVAATPQRHAPATTATSYLAGNSEGWWPDPAERYDLRYFSGAFWTNRVADASGQESTDPDPIATAR